MLPHAYQDCPYVDILGWLADQDRKKKAEETEDEVIQIVKIRMIGEVKKLKRDYKLRVKCLNDREKRRRQDRSDRTQVIHRVIKAAKLAHSYPVLPEHDDPLKKQDKYL